MKTRARDQKGVAAIEFALVLPLLCVFLFGMIEFGILLYDKAMITNASREGARAGIVYSPDGVDPSNVNDAVNHYCGSHLITFGGSTNVGISINQMTESFGEVLKVRVTYRYDFLVLPNFVSELAGGLDLAAESIMRIEE